MFLYQFKAFVIKFCLINLESDVLYNYYFKNYISTK